jgi:hypothetical protein
MLPIQEPGRKKTGARVDHFGQSRSQTIFQSFHNTSGSRLLGEGKTPLGRCRQRPHHEVDQFCAVSQGDRRRGGADLAIPVAEHDCAGVGVPGRSKVQVVAPHVGEEDTVGRRFGHATSMHPTDTRC